MFGSQRIQSSLIGGKLLGLQGQNPLERNVCVCVIAWNDYDKTIGIPVLKLTRGLLLLG